MIKKSDNSAKESSSSKIRITQLKSIIGCKPGQRNALIGLGLKGIGSTRIFSSSGSISGMVNKVKHMVSLENI